MVNSPIPQNGIPLALTTTAICACARSAQLDPRGFFLRPPSKDWRWKNRGSRCPPSSFQRGNPVPLRCFGDMILPNQLPRFRETPSLDPAKALRPQVCQRQKRFDASKLPSEGRQSKAESHPENLRASPAWWLGASKRGSSPSWRKPSCACQPNLLAACGSEHGQAAEHK